MVLELPITSDAAQNVITQLGDTKYELDIVYNDRSGVWSLSVKLFATQVVIAQSVPMLLGQSLLEPYNFDMGHLLMIDLSGQSKDAGPDDLGTRVKLYWFSDEELA